MSITATPTLTVAGVDVLNTSDTLAVDALRVPWGRTGVLDPPTPATATITVLDRTSGATLAGRSDLIGQPVLAGWVGGGSSGVFFRGRITDAAATRRDGGGFFLSVSCSSNEADAGNYTAPPGTSWPAELFANRRDRIMGLLPVGVFPGGAVLPTMTALNAGPELNADLGDFAGYPCVAADVSGRTVLELLTELWASCYPVPLVYDPAADGFTYAPRHRVGAAPVVELAPDVARGGLFTARPHGGGWALPAGLIGYDGPVAQRLEGRLTRVEVTYQGTMGQAATAVATTVDTASESVIGRRMIQVASIIGGSDRVDTYAANLAGGWAAIASGEGRARVLEPLTVDTDRTPFVSTAQAAALLAGRETGDRFFLGGSWLTRLGVQPQFGVLGGVIGYADGRWQLELNPVRVSTPAPVPLTIAAAGPTTLAQIDESVTFGDLAFVDAITTS